MRRHGALVVLLAAAWAVAAACATEPIDVPEPLPAQARTAAPAATPPEPTATTASTVRHAPVSPPDDMLRRQEEVLAIPHDPDVEPPHDPDVGPPHDPDVEPPDSEPPSTEAPATAEEPEIASSSAFSVSIAHVSAEDLGASWREGCPVPPAGLRLLEMSHHGYDGAVHTGRLVVHPDWAEEVVGVFRALFEAGFPIERMEPVDVYDGSDAASMAANNTSAFNCRPVAGTDRWSEHAYGRAIDVNPFVNPYVRGDVVDPPGGAAYLDRDPAVSGLIVDGDVAVRSFAAIGWGWGGHWSSAKDYQHFSSTGR